MPPDALIIFAYNNPKMAKAMNNTTKKLKIPAAVNVCYAAKTPIQPHLNFREILYGFRIES